MESQDTASSCRPVRVLLIEDNPGDVELTIEALAEGRVLNELQVAVDGEEALRRLRREGEHVHAPRPDLILLDLNLPRMNGRQVLDAIKSDPALREIPVVVLTSSQAEADVRGAYEHHANAYVVKPIDLPRFLAAVQLIEQFWLELVALPSGWQGAPPPADAAPNRPRVSRRTVPAVTAARDEVELGFSARSLLLVEDNPGDAELIAEYLEEAAPGKMSLELVETLAAAQARLGRPGIDLVLLDLFLPDAAGLETFQGIYAVAPDLPVVVLTGLNDGRLALRAMQAGAQDYLVKGQINGELLVRSIRYAVERAQGQQQLRQAQKMEAVGRLAGGVAHDFNNMLAVISGYSELLLMACPEDDLSREPLLQIRSAGQRAAALTRQLLAFGRRQLLHPARVDVGLLLDNLRGMLAQMVGEQIRLVVECAPDLEPIYADAGQIEQVILNLTFNARDAMPRGGRLTVGAKRVDLSETESVGPPGLRPGTYICLSVEDTGTGIAEEDRPHLFEPFFTTKEQGKGTGLGLASVYGIVRQSEGDIEVKSEVGRGTVFRVYFPAVREPGPEVVALPPEVALPGRETVLILEDEPSLLRLIGDILDSHGYRTLLAGHSEEALRLASEHEGPIHVLLADVVMPGLHGPEVAARIRPLRPELRVLFMTGYADEVMLGYDLTPTDEALLQKPFSHATLTARIRRLLDAPPA
ncbi:MAG: sensory box histidine kinase/response regulator [Armatimonadetes bacterium]|jgi:signal transduction histidine kinase|nr:sensory box histidine kinase/response regulator [Armatimonadota bacterium]